MTNLKRPCFVPNLWWRTSKVVSSLTGKGTVVPFWNVTNWDDLQILLYRNPSPWGQDSSSLTCYGRNETKTKTNPVGSIAGRVEKHGVPMVAKAKEAFGSLHLLSPKHEYAEPGLPDPISVPLLSPSLASPLQQGQGPQSPLNQCMPSHLYFAFSLRLICPRTQLKPAPPPLHSSDLPVHTYLFLLLIPSMPKVWPENLVLNLKVPSLFL